VVKAQRGTETGDTPVWQGATRENTGRIWPRSNAGNRMQRRSNAAGLSPRAA